MNHTPPTHTPSKHTHKQRDQLWRQALPLVRPIAQQYARQSPECLEDLIQVGSIGLLAAAERYQVTSGVPFDCYARPHIRGAILHHLRDLAYLVRLPRRQAEWRQQLSRAPRGVDASSGSIALQQRDRLESLRQWSALTKPVPLESLTEQDELTWQPLSGAYTPAMAAIGADSYVPDGVDQAWARGSVEQLLALVDQRKRQVLRRVLLEGMSYRRTARAMGISAPTVQRLLHAALAELRRHLSSAELRSQSPLKHRAPSAAAGS